MEIRVLRYFLTVVREENITRAADILHITQPTLSRQLAELEEELGVPLFIRGKRKLALTDAGVLLRRRAEEIVELADKTEQEFSAPSPELTGLISIGSAVSSSARIWARLLDTFHARYPLVRYDLLFGNAEQIRERIDKGLIDIALLIEPTEIERYEYLRLREKEVWGVDRPAGRSPGGKRSGDAGGPAGPPSSDEQAVHGAARAGLLVRGRVRAADPPHLQSAGQRRPAGGGGTGLRYRH